MPIPAPPLQEQRRIVRMIDAINMQERAIEGSIYKLGMIELGLVEKEFEGLEFGKFWEILEFGPKNGLYKSESSYVAEGTPIVRIDSYEGGPSDLSRDLLRVDISEDEIDRYGLMVGDILINRVNSLELVGKSTMVSKLAGPTVFESNLMRCRVRADRAISRFVELWLGCSRVKRYFRMRAKSAISQASINGDDVLSCPFPRISVARQYSIIRQVDYLVQQRRCEGIELEKLRTLKQGIVNNLLSGKR